ncbi:MAG: thioredoxin domain-containing protein [Nannocystis sp.]|nr:thioredoxin domain-containing protein [Nannocystis sp.]MBA3550467.1 thioredoxin domain-containing protein [Nannocystis sp.]
MDPATSPGEPDADTLPLKAPVTDRDHSRGPPDAPVTLVEYGDYECPYCRRAHQVMKTLLHTMHDRLRFVYRNFPLTTLHPHAALAAQASEAADLQGTFWEMHDTLYEHRDARELVDIQQYAVALGLDLDQFVADMASEEVMNRVKEEFRGGVRSGVNSTPTFFLNGARYNGDYDLQSLTAALEKAAGANR